MVCRQGTARARQLYFAFTAYHSSHTRITRTPHLFRPPDIPHAHIFDSHSSDSGSPRRRDEEPVKMEEDSKEDRGGRGGGRGRDKEMKAFEMPVCDQDIAFVLGKVGFYP